MNFNNILFLDIETVSQFETYNHLPDDWKELWDAKATIINKNKETETSETSYHRSAIYAEFGKIVCISCGVLQGAGEERKIILKSFCCDDEKQLLKDFADMVREQCHERFDNWLIQAANSEFSSFRRFARGLRQDYTEVEQWTSRRVGEPLEAD